MKFKGGEIRSEAFNKLKVFLKNPGRFCLIVIGSRGVGKHQSIEYAFEEIKTEEDKELCLEALEFIEPNIVPEHEECFDQFLEKYIGKTVVIEDVEELTLKQQKLLFKALSTKDGTFGIDNSYRIRFVFTSSADVDSLREDGEYLSGMLWDRISQLVIEFPSYKQEGENIVSDFKFTWQKMKYEDIDEFKHFANVPKNASLEKFLEDNAGKFEGGFRDLDKLVCMYLNYRIYHYGDRKRIDESLEKKVVDSIKSDFFSKSQMQGSSGNDLSSFQIRSGFSMSELLGQFKIQVRKWAKKEYSTIKNAEVKLELKPGTMKNYVKGKVTKRQRDKNN